MSTKEPDFKEALFAQHSVPEPAWKALAAASSLNPQPPPAPNGPPRTTPTHHLLLLLLRAPGEAFPWRSHGVPNGVPTVTPMVVWIHGFGFHCVSEIGGLSCLQLVQTGLKEGFTQLRPRCSDRWPAATILP
ncbi:unnamed protein product [Gadus morhua 'NCC']